MHISQMSDSAGVYDLEKRLQDVAERLAGMVPSVGKARQVRAFESDRRKRALAVAMVTFLDQGESATAAECKARATFTYAEAMKTLGGEMKSAESVLAEWDALHVMWETARSPLSATKEMARM